MGFYYPNHSSITRTTFFASLLSLANYLGYLSRGEEGHGDGKE